MPTWRRAVFRTLWTAAWVLDRAARVMTHAATGVLTRAELRAVLARRWRSFGRGEALVRSGLWESELRFYTGNLRRDDRILLIGCGTGRDLLGLRRLGHRVDGLELSPETAAIARAALAREQLDGEVSVGAVETMAFTRMYDVFLFSWYVYGYVVGAPTRVAVLRRLRDALRPGGRILLSYITRGGDRDLSVVTRIAGRLSAADWRAEAGDVVDEAGERGAVSYEHRFRPEEIEDEARAAGLCVVAHERGEEGLVVLAAGNDGAAKGPESPSRTP